MESSADLLSSLLPLVALFAIFYFLIIRPQQKQAKNHKDMIAGLQKGDKIVTNGGRVLGITATGKDLKTARENAYEAVNWIDFDNKYMRSDIGKSIDEV